MSRYAWLGLLAVLLLAAADAPKGPEESKELSLLRGPWKTVPRDIRLGKDVYPKDRRKAGPSFQQFLEQREAEYKDGKWAYRAGRGPERQASVTIDPSKDPKQITFAIGPDKDNRVLAIYTVKDDTLELCLSGTNRPKEFKDTDSSVLLTFQKAKR